MRTKLINILLGASAAVLLPACSAETSNSASEQVDVQTVDRTADLNAFRNDFLGQDNSYSAEARAQAETLLNDLDKNAGALSDIAYELKLAEIVALADNGHTLYFTGPWREKYNRIPVKFLILDGRLYIGATDGAHAALKGVEVTRIGDRSWNEVRAALSKYQGGLENWKANFLQNFIESPEVLHAAGLIDDPSSVTLTFIENGAAHEVEIAAQNLPADLSGFEQYIPPARTLELVRNGEADIETLPLYLQNQEDVFRMEWLDGDIAYVQFKANRGEMDGVDARGFSANVIEALETRTPSQVILDQRFNSGGDLNTTRDLMQALPSLVADGGKVYAITSGKTFSAGISSVGYLEQAGGDNVVIVGEPVGDRLEFWAEGDVMELPQSGAMVLYATERHNYRNGCQEADCHGSIREHPIAVETLDPDYLAPLTYDDFIDGRDPSMDQVMALIANS